MNLIFNFGFEPAINAFGMEQVIANRDLLNIDAFLVFFETYHTLILLEFIHSLIIPFLFNQILQVYQSLLHLLLLRPSLILNLHLIDDILLVPSLPHAYPDDADHAYTDKHCEHYEEDHRYYA